MRWPHYEHVFFDCDSTLTTVEGIDVLAESAGKKQSVEELTQAAMDGKMDLADIYGERLQVVQPSRQQISEIRAVYRRNIVEDAAALIEALHFLGHKCYIISGGLEEPVREFGIHLGVPGERIRAVGVAYDELSGVWWESGDSPAGNQQGQQYLDYEQGHLTVSDGKKQIVAELLGDQSGRSLLVGDGHSDLLAGDAVDLFVGFGGVVKREVVAAEAPAFIQSASLAPLLALAAGPVMLSKLNGSAHQPVADKCNELIDKGMVTFNDEKLRDKFRRALWAASDQTY